MHTFHEGELQSFESAIATSEIYMTNNGTECDHLVNKIKPTTVDSSTNRQNPTSDKRNNGMPKTSTAAS